MNRASWTKQYRGDYPIFWLIFNSIKLMGGIADHIVEYIVFDLYANISWIYIGESCFSWITFLQMHLNLILSCFIFNVQTFGFGSCRWKFVFSCFIIVILDMKLIGVVYCIGRDYHQTVFVLEDLLVRKYPNGRMFGFVLSSASSFKTALSIVGNEKHLETIKEGKSSILFATLQDGTVKIGQNTVVSIIFIQSD